VISVTHGLSPAAEVPHMQKRRIGASGSGRIFTSIPVEVRVNGRKVEGTVRNANEGGMFVETRSIPMQGEAVSLRFLQRSISNVEVKGLVWWTTEGSSFRHRHRGFGFRLLEDDERYSAMLASLRPVISPTQAAQQRLRAAASVGIPGSGRSPRSR
jgi:hypothetical protein